MQTEFMVIDSVSPQCVLGLWTKLQISTCFHPQIQGMCSLIM